MQPDQGKPRETSASRLIAMLQTAIGPHIRELLADRTVIELLLNQDGKLWVDRLGRGREFTGHLITPQDAERIVKLVASAIGNECNESHPIVGAEFPGDGNRFQGLLPPVVSAPVFAIRKKAIQIFTLDDYVEQQILSPYEKQVICQAVQEKKNILVVGGTGSGKTTLVNAILDEIAKTGDRIVIIEDTLELQCSAPDTLSLRAKDGVATMNDLLKATMRLRPDRIVVGEVRGGEALTLLKSWNTGHPGGVATVHANSARGGLTRLEQLILEAVVTVSRDLIAEAVNLVVHIERTGRGRAVREILMITGMKSGEYQTAEVKEPAGLSAEKR